jgi:hypothetical protein
MEIVIGSANMDYSLDYILEMGTLWTEQAGLNVGYTCFTFVSPYSFQCQKIGYPSSISP